MNTLKPARPAPGPICLLIASTLAATLASFTAQASEQATERRTLTVKFGDLNLATPGGIDALEHRLHNAAAQVCTDKDGTRDLRAAFARERCINEAVSRALADARVQRSFS
jgi:UrcA family protein